MVHLYLKVAYINGGRLGLRKPFSGLGPNNERWKVLHDPGGARMICNTAVQRASNWGKRLRLYDVKTEYCSGFPQQVVCVKINHFVFIVFSENSAL